MWWKQNKWKVIVPVLIVIVLAAAFWLGGNAPGLQGWPTDDDKPQAVESVAPQVPETPAASEAPDATEAPAESTEPIESAEPTESEVPQTTPTLQPEPTAAPDQGMIIDPETGKDQYLTDPVPAGKPIPVEPNQVTVSDVAHSCSIAIYCDTILDNMDWLDPEKVELVPEDGVILPPTTVTFYEGESVFNVLQRTCKQNRIHMEFVDTPMYNSAYIEGIHNLYEFDCGEQSGWMYCVNDWFPNYGVSRYQVLAGDVIEFRYTCNLGKDVGGQNALG